MKEAEENAGDEEVDEEKENIEIKEIKDKKEKQKEAVAKQHNFSTQKVGLWFEIDITVFTVCLILDFFRHSGSTMLAFLDCCLPVNLMLQI